MTTESWPKIRVKRFYQEPDGEYAKRRDEIVFIVEGFRHNRFLGRHAELMDRRLEGLLSGDYDPASAVIGRRFDLADA